jgi:putative molybdopterin biosynthesis protein
MSRKVYLEDIPLDEAWRRFIAALEAAGLWRPFDGEEIPVADALGRVTAEPIWARVSSPAYHAAAMDGYAVRSGDTLGATETVPVRLPLDSHAAYVDTGDPLPAWADAVIPIEHVHLIHQQTSQPTTRPLDQATTRPLDQATTRPLDQATTRLPDQPATQLIDIEILASVAPWSNVRSMGEDMVATELVLPANHTLRPVDLGAIAGCGYAVLKVRRKPRVAIIPTGTELITAEQAAGAGVEPGDIIEYNSIVLAAEVAQWGGLPIRYPIIPDDYERIKATVLDAAPKHDLVLVNAGSSAGSEDYTAHIVEELGTLLVHGVAVRPGHPVILGLLQPPNSKLQTLTLTPIIGIPGYPVSAALTGEIFVEPLLAKWRGQPSLRKPTMRATITRKLLSPMGEDEWVRVTVGRVGNRVVAAPLSRGAGVITSLARADGIVRIPRFSEGVNSGDEVTVELYTTPDEIERTIVHIGSHDLTLDLLAQFMAEAGRRFVSANAGSLGGLIALRRGEAHVAGSHLLDPETGEYNVAYVKQYLPDISVVLVTLLRREQGLIAAKGNPKRIESLADLARPDVRYVNRQRGAGTRVLLDYRLGQLGIAPEQVRGYEREEYTHLAVAAAVQSGVADCGLGVRAAARALALDFVSVEWERYDLVMPRQHYESDLLRPLLDLLRDKSFQQAVADLPGYDPSPMGTLAATISL